MAGCSSTRTSRTATSSSPSSCSGGCIFGAHGGIPLTAPWHKWGGWYKSIHPRWLSVLLGSWSRFYSSWMSPCCLPSVQPSHISCLCRMCSPVFAHMQVPSLKPWSSLECWHGKLTALKWSLLLIVALWLPNVSNNSMFWIFLVIVMKSRRVFVRCSSLL